MKPDKYYLDLEKEGYFDSLDKRTKDYKEYKEWKKSYEAKNLDVSYQEIKKNIDTENSVGLGDVVEAVTKATGIKKVVEAVTDDCGCDQRKKRFNKIHLWRRRKVNCIEQDDYVWLKNLIKENPTRYDFDTRERLVNVYNSVFNTNQKNSKCYPCIRSLIDNLKEYLKVWEDAGKEDA